MSSNLFNKIISPNVVKSYWVVAILVFPIFYGAIYDDSLESSKIILNIIKYSDGHPIQFHLFAFNLLNYISALILFISNDNILNNIRFIFVNIIQILTFFYIAKQLTNTLWAQIILLFLYLGSISVFNIYLNYSINFPEYYATHGGIGLSVFILILALISSNEYKIASFIFGLLPAFHIGFVFPIIVWCLFKIIIDKERHNILSKSNIYAYLLGSILPIITYIIIQWRVEGIIPHGLYKYNDIDYKLWFDFVNNYDRHRRGPLLSSYLPFFISLYILVLIKYIYSQYFNKKTIELIKVLLVICATYLSIALIANFTNYILNYFQVDSSYYLLSYLLLSWMPYRYDAVILLVSVILCFKILFISFYRNSYRLEIFFVLTIIILLQIFILIFNQTAINSYRQFMVGLLWQLTESIILCHSANYSSNNYIFNRCVLYFKKHILFVFLLFSLLLCYITNKIYWLNNISYIMYGSIAIQILIYITHNTNICRLKAFTNIRLKDLLVLMILFSSIILIIFHSNTLKTNVSDKFMMDSRVHRLLEKQVSSYFSTNLVDAGKYIITPLNRKWRFLGAKHNIPIIMTTDTLWFGIYMPRYLSIIQLYLVEIYGRILFKDNLSSSQNNIWINRTYQEWLKLSKKYDIQYVMTDYKLHKLTAKYNDMGLFIYEL